MFCTAGVSDNTLVANIGFPGLVPDCCWCSFPFRRIYCRNQCTMAEVDIQLGCTSATEGICSGLLSDNSRICRNTEDQDLNNDVVSKSCSFLTIQLEEVYSSPFENISAGHRFIGRNIPVSPCSYLQVARSPYREISDKGDEG